MRRLYIPNINSISHNFRMQSFATLTNPLRTLALLWYNPLSSYSHLICAIFVQHFNWHVLWRFRTLYNTFCMNRWGVFLRPNDRWYFLMLLLIFLLLVCLLWVNMPHWNVHAEARHVASVGNQQSHLLSSPCHILWEYSLRQALPSFPYLFVVVVAAVFCLLMFSTLAGVWTCFLYLPIRNVLYVLRTCWVNSVWELSHSPPLSLTLSRSLWCLLIYAGQSKFRLYNYHLTR